MIRKAEASEFELKMLEEGLSKWSIVSLALGNIDMIITVAAMRKVVDTMRKRMEEKNKPDMAMEDPIGMGMGLYETQDQGYV